MHQAAAAAVAAPLAVGEDGETSQGSSTWLDPLPQYKKSMSNLAENVEKRWVLQKRTFWTAIDGKPQERTGVVACSGYIVCSVWMWTLDSDPDFCCSLTTPPVNEGVSRGAPLGRCRYPEEASERRSFVTNPSAAFSPRGDLFSDVVRSVVILFREISVSEVIFGIVGLRAPRAVSYDQRGPGDEPSSGTGTEKRKDDDMISETDRENSRAAKSMASMERLFGACTNRKMPLFTPAGHLLGSVVICSRAILSAAKVERTEKSGCQAQAWQLRKMTRVRLWRAWPF